ncbi:MAG: flagellar type III secretion system protein FliR [Firmicutes bacterium]|nr:flagellar type III secretion system protein FliR [Bacillota bacterium]
MDVDTVIERFPALLLIFVRFSGLMATMPVFSSRYIPVRIRVMVAGFLAVFALPSVTPVEVPGSLVGLALFAVNELAVGMAVGYAASVVLSAIQLAGQLIDTELGFGMVNVIDPQYGLPAPLFGNFYYLIALMLLLAVGGERATIAALVRSFKEIPIGAIVSPPEPGFVVDLVAGVFTTALKISAPLLGALFLVTLALGIVARTVPQMNVFIVGLPVKLVAGLIVLVAGFPVYLGLVDDIVSDMVRAAEGAARLLAR